MLSQEKLDRFLDAFLDNKGVVAQDGIDFRDDEDAGQLPEDEERFWERQKVLTAPVRKGKLTRRTIVALLLLVVAIPLTIWVGMVFFDDRKYLVVALAIAVYSMIPFFLVFEGRKPQARELLIIAVLVAIAVASRAVLYMVPNFKPVAALAIIAAVAFGAESGFFVGSVSMLASNMLFGQGPWTPWQMCSMGLIGFVAGLMFQKGWLKATKPRLCAYGFVSVIVLYGGIMNPASLAMFTSDITIQTLVLVYLTGFPLDLVHAISTAFFLWVAAKPMLEKLNRIKVKYGLISGAGD